jgi:hypothetical protein
MVVMNSNISSVYAHEPPIAAECVLRWCVKTIEAQCQNGVYSETISSTYTNDSVLPDQFKWFYNSITGTSAAHTAYDIIITPPNQTETFVVPKNVNSQTLVSLEGLIPTYISAWNVTADPYWKVPWSDNLEPLNYGSWPKPDSIAEYSERIASAFTTVIRNYPNSSLPVFGYGGVETYVHIQWGWLALPLILVLGSLILLVNTIRNAVLMGGNGIWKTSLLASLLHGLDETSRRDFGDAWNLSDMRAKAMASSVVFTPRLDGFRFHKHTLAVDEKF